MKARASNPILLLAVAVAAADCARPLGDAESEYLRVRRAAEAEADAQWKAGKRDGFNDAQILADLTRRLNAIIGPVSVSGFPQPGRISREGICIADDSCFALDALVFRSDDWSHRLAVTTPALVNGWLDDQKTNVGMPNRVEAALRDPQIFIHAFDGNATTLKYADLEIPDARRRGIVSAMLVLQAQDIGNWPPEQVAVSVLRSNRVYIIVVPTAVKIELLPACSAILDSAYKSRRQRSMAEDDQLHERYRECYARNLSVIPGVDQIMRQVTTLVDALPP